jgi:hypothetical protein
MATNPGTIPGNDDAEVPGQMPDEVMPIDDPDSDNDMDDDDEDMQNDMDDDDGSMPQGK